MVGVADSISAQRTTCRTGQFLLAFIHAQIAQLVRAPSSHGGGPAFESLFEHQKVRPLRIAQRPFCLCGFYCLLIKGFYR